jgi:hypothetical protein
VPAKPEDENQGDPTSNAVDVADMGLQGASALLGPRGSSVPSVSGAPDAAAAASAPVETEAAAQAKTAATSSDSGLSVVGDIAEGVVDVITGIFDAT